MNHMIGKRCQQHYRRHAMQRPSKGKMLLPLPHRPRPPGVGIFQRESGNHQHRKTDHREPVRKSEIEIHPLHFFAGIDPRRFAKKLAQIIEQVVEEHESERQRNQNPIRYTDRSHHRMFRDSFRTHMHRPDGKRIASPRMALAARARQVCRIHRGTRIVRRKNVVHAVARRAIRHSLRASTQS